MHIPAPNDVIRRDLPDAAIHSPKTRRAERTAKRRRLSLALQGGGSFGAFTWGVLDRLLEEEDLPFDVASGASAGAINAVVMATGLAGREGRARGGASAPYALLDARQRGRAAGKLERRGRDGDAAALALSVQPLQREPAAHDPLGRGRFRRAARRSRRCGSSSPATG